TCRDNVLDLSRLQRESVKEWLFVNVVAVLVPLINVARAGGNFVPLRVLIGEIAIKFSKNFRRESGLHGVAHFGQAGPEVAQKYFVSVFVRADRFFGHIEIDAACECERDNQWRGHQEIGFDVLMNACFEITVSGKDGRGNQIVIMNGFLDLGVEWTGIANAGRATIPDEIEAELVEISLQSSFR